MATYLDHAASTTLRAEAFEAMVPWLRDHAGNPSGAHRAAREARRAIDDARDQVAALAGCEPGDVVFTSGGTEADNAAVDGVLRAVGGLPVCSAIEHHAVLEPVLEHGGRVVRVDERGVVDVDHLAASIDESVSFVSVMLVNNETGVVQPIDEIATAVRQRAPDAVVHCDAVQGAPWLDLAEHCAEVDLLSLTGHKFGGPKGAGALVVRDGTPFTPILRGGGQERERRSGTHNVPAIVGLGAAAECVQRDRSTHVPLMTSRRERLERGLVEAAAVRRTVPEGVDRSPGIAHVCIPGLESEPLLFLMEDAEVFASAASSCASGAQEPSHVLAAMGVPRDVAKGSLRLSLGHDSTDADVDRALEIIPPAIDRLRSHG